MPVIGDSQQHKEMIPATSETIGNVLFRPAPAGDADCGEFCICSCLLLGSIADGGAHSCAADDGESNGLGDEVLTTGSGSLNCGKLGAGGSYDGGFGPLNGEGIGGVVFPNGDSFGRSEPNPLDGCENGDEGGISRNDGGLKLGSENFGGSGASGGISITWSSAASLAFISVRISSSEANIVFKGSGSAGSCRTSSSFGGSGTGALELTGGIAAAISSGRATIVLYGSRGASSTNGVPSDWQNRIESSNVLSQIGHFFIGFILKLPPKERWLRYGRRDGSLKQANLWT